MSETDKIAADLERARAQLNHAAADLDEFSIARLRAGRKRALAAADARRRFRPAWWLPLSSAAVAAIVTVTVATNWWRAAPVTATEDIELLATSDDPEFLEDIDFYNWLEDQRDAG
jgi:4-hydroxy-L-threonine phosphate dehydrogenase PdxA